MMAIRSGMRRKRPANSRSIVVFTSDQHFNSTRGLCPYRITRHEGGTHEASRPQKWLWDCWTLFWKEEVQNIRQPEDKLHLIFVGDLVDGGSHHNTHETISRNEITQHTIALEGLKPALSLNPDSVHIIKGTDVHVGDIGSWEEYVARDIEAVPDKEHGVAAWWWLRAEFNGVLFDIAHHGKAGRLEWTFPNSANAQAAQTIIRYAGRGERCPDVVIRADRHRYLTSGDNYQVEVTGLPSWQLQTSYGNQISPDGILPIGGLVYICKDGRYERRRRLFYPDPPQIWRPE
jgi:hypothetical protein